ncbi:MAG: proton-conducting transporter membrane subunit, partial [Candidatus Margulisiibacteriota bacterium]
MIPALLIFPFIATPLLLLLKSKKTNTVLYTAYALFFLFASFYLLKHPANWTDYFAVDALNSLFLIILGITNIAVVIYNLGYLAHTQLPADRHTYKTIFFLWFLFSLCGAMLSTNLGLFWVFLEATTLATAYLINFEETRNSLEAAWKYMFICSVGISLAFIGIIFMVISAGSLNSLFLPDLYQNAASFSPFWLKLSLAFIVVGFATKMGLAPVHAWLPDAHSEAPAPVSAMLSGTLLNLPLLGILRIFKIYEIAGLGHYITTLLLVMGFLSVFIGAVYIPRVKNYKRLLAYSSIENMGLIIIAAAIGGAALWAAMLQLVVHSLI